MNTVRQPRPDRPLLRRPVGRDQLHPPAGLQPAVLRPAAADRRWRIAAGDRGASRCSNDRAGDRPRRHAGRAVHAARPAHAARWPRRCGERRAGEVQLRDLLRALDAAQGRRAHRARRAAHRRLRRRRLRLAARSSARRVREFRAGGKQVVAYGELMDQKQYLLAAQADEVYLDPKGGDAARRPRPLSPVLPRGPAGQARRRRAPVPRRRIQVGRRALRARRRFAGIARSRPVLDERPVAALPRRHRQGAQARRRGARRAGHRQLPERVQGRRGRPRQARAATRSWSTA